MGISADSSKYEASIAGPESFEQITSLPEVKGIAIDSIGAKTRDDAIYAQQRPDGGFDIWVSITADGKSLGVQTNIVLSVHSIISGDGETRASTVGLARLDAEVTDHELFKKPSKELKDQEKAIFGAGNALGQAQRSGRGLTGNGLSIVELFMTHADEVLAAFARDAGIPVIFMQHDSRYDFLQLRNKPPVYTLTPDSDQAVSGRFTSPLRQTMDRMNLGNITAFFRGQETAFPYDQEALQLRISNSNESIRSTMALRTAGDPVGRVLVKLVEGRPNPLHTLKNSKLADLVERLTARPELLSGALPEIIERMQSNDVGVRLIEKILTYVRNYDGSPSDLDSLIDAVFRNLSQHAQYAKQIIVNLVDNQDATNYRQGSLREGRYHYGHVTVDVNSGSFYAEHRSPNKQKALLGAQAKLLAKMHGYSYAVAQLFTSPSL